MTYIKHIKDEVMLVLILTSVLSLITALMIGTVKLLSLI